MSVNDGGQLQTRVTDCSVFSGSISILLSSGVVTAVPLPELGALVLFSRKCIGKSKRGLPSRPNVFGIDDDLGIERVGVT